MRNYYHVKTQEAYDNLMAFLEEQGYVWATGLEPTKTDLWKWHKEKTASLSFSQSKQIFKCFGCGEGGDVLTFLMKINNQSFAEVIEEQLTKACVPILVTFAPSITSPSPFMLVSDEQLLNI